MSSSSEHHPAAPPMKMIAVPKGSIGDRLDGTEKRVAQLERWLRRMFKVCAALATVVALVIGLMIYLLVGRATSRSYYNNQIRDLVCAVPPGDETRDLLRERAKCGPYKPPSRRNGSPRSSSPSSSPSQSPRPTVTGEAGLESSASRPTATVTRPAQPNRPSTAPAPRRPAPTTRTVPDRTPTATRTRTVTPTPSGTDGLLPGLLCTLLGCA